MFIIIWSIVFIACVVLYLRQVNSRFTKYGVKHLPALPLFGSMAPVTFRRVHWAECVQKSYNAFPGERFIGHYEFMTPMLIIKDIELIKKITVKDFEHFVDHRVLIDVRHDELFGRHLFSLRGEEWKDMRSTLSPAFTSSKIRLMVPFIREASNQMMTNLTKRMKDSKSDHLDLDVKNLTTRYATDVIGSCAFGLKVDSHNEENNEFYVMGKETANFTFLKVLKFFFISSVPSVNSIIKLSLFSKECKDFFRNVVINTMKEREARNIFRPDMIHLLMEAKKGQLTHDGKPDTDAGFATVEESSIGKVNKQIAWSDDDLVAQAIIFFIAGFETVSTAMSFLIHELAQNPDIQERLFEEIRDYDLKSKTLDYTAIQNLTYLDMVVSEILRLYPPVNVMDRKCEKDYNMGRPNKMATEDYFMRKGESMYLSVWSIHRDPEYFPNPMKFDPERFSDQNKHNIKPFTYMPFGLGPRNCIGSRFALCEIKVMIYELLLKMQLSPAPNTKKQVKLCKSTFNLQMEGGEWVRLRKRSKV